MSHFNTFIHVSLGPEPQSACVWIRENSTSLKHNRCFMQGWCVSAQLTLAMVTAVLEPQLFESGATANHSDLHPCSPWLLLCMLIFAFNREHSSLAKGSRGSFILYRHRGLRQHTPSFLTCCHTGTRLYTGECFLYIQ